MREPGEHFEELEFDYLEIEPDKFIDLKVSVRYTITSEECTSTFGEQSVSEGWEETNLDSWEIESIRFIESHDYPITETHKQKIEGEIYETITDIY
jgi:hypothetical protein